MKEEEGAQKERRVVILEDVKDNASLEIVMGEGRRIICWDCDHVRLECYVWKWRDV